MERRHFLKLAFGVAAGAATLAASVEAAPLAPHALVEEGRLPGANEDARPAVTTAEEVDRLKPEEVRWGRQICVCAKSNLSVAATQKEGKSP